MSCPVDPTFALPACPLGDDGARLKASLIAASDWLERHFRPGDPYDAPFRYRSAYMPTAITGADVAAVSHVYREASRLGAAVPDAVTPLYKPGETVTSDDVLYLTDNAGAVADAIDGTMADLQVKWAARDQWQATARAVAIVGSILFGVLVGAAYAARKGA